MGGDGALVEDLLKHLPVPGKRRQRGRERGSEAGRCGGERDENMERGRERGGKIWLRGGRVRNVRNSSVCYHGMCNILHRASLAVVSQPFTHLACTHVNSVALI